MDAERASKCLRTWDAVIPCAFTLNQTLPPLLKGYLSAELLFLGGYYLAFCASLNRLKNRILLTKIHIVRAKLFSVMLSSSLRQTQYIPEAVTPMGITSSRVLSVNGFLWQSKQSYLE